MKRLGTRLLLAVSLVLPVTASSQAGRMGGMRPGGFGSVRGTPPVSHGGFGSGHAPVFRGVPPNPPTFVGGNIFGHPIGTISTFGNPTFFVHGFNGRFGHHHNFGNVVVNPYPFYYYPPFGWDSYGQQDTQSYYGTPNTVYVPVPDPSANAQPQTQAAALPPPQSDPGVKSTRDEARPVEPTVLVFRDGHTQEVSNYAIMGTTLFVFSGRTAKISLADLDIPATVHVNDDRGVNFSIPDSSTHSR